MKTRMQQLRKRQWQDVFLLVCSLILISGFLFFYLTANATDDTSPNVRTHAVEELDVMNQSGEQPIKYWNETRQLSGMQWYGKGNIRAVVIRSENYPYSRRSEGYFNVKVYRVYNLSSQSKNASEWLTKEIKSGTVNAQYELVNLMAKQMTSSSYDSQYVGEGLGINNWYAGKNLSGHHYIDLVKISR